MIKWCKVADHQYETDDGTWKAIGFVAKDNPTRQPKITYRLKQNGVDVGFSGGLNQAKRYVRTNQ